MNTYKHKENDKELKVIYKINKESESYGLLREVMYADSFDVVDVSNLIIVNRIEDLKNQIFVLINNRNSINECIDCIVSDGLCKYTDATLEEEKLYQLQILNWLQLEI